MRGQLIITFSYKVTGAHSPLHQVFWIKENDETIFFGGDDAPQLQQMKHRFSAKYDFDGKKAMELRREWWELGEKEKWSFLFYHDIKTPIYTNFQITLILARSYQKARPEKSRPLLTYEKHQGQKLYSSFIV